MKEIIINIPDDSSELVIELVEKLGGSVDKKEKRIKGLLEVNSNRQKKVAQSKKKIKKEKIDHTYLFGKWKDFDIDIKKIREELWRNI
ncbi:MAG: hypothetical protein ABI184_01875 [Ginsengibacter sp.]